LHDDPWKILAKPTQANAEQAAAENRSARCS